MKRTTTSVMGLAALVAMLVLGVFSAGSAQAHVFLTLGTLPALLLVLGDGLQVFTAVEGGPQVKCKHARFHGKVTTESQLTQTVVGTYTGCEAAGFEATVSPAEYELNANETVSILNKTIVITVKTVNCSIAVAPQNTLKGIRYLKDIRSPEIPRLLAHVEVEKIVSTIVGGSGLCGAEGEHETGLYRGLLLAWVEAGGSIHWV